MDEWDLMFEEHRTYERIVEKERHPFGEKKPSLHTIVNGVECKKCVRCGRVLPLTEYHVQRNPWKNSQTEWDGHTEWCKDCVSMGAKKWQQTHPEERKAIVARRRARQAEAEGAEYTTAEHRQARWKLYKGRCYLCGKPATDIDHVIPLSRGGPEWPANLRPICRHCNSKKHANWPYDFEKHRQEEGYYERGGIWNS